MEEYNLISGKYNTEDIMNRLDCSKEVDIAKILLNKNLPNVNFAVFSDGGQSAVVQSRQPEFLGSERSTIEAILFALEYLPTRMPTPPRDPTSHWSDIDKYCEKNNLSLTTGTLYFETWQQSPSNVAENAQSYVDSLRSYYMENKK